MNKKIINIFCLGLLIVGIFAWSKELAGNPGATNLSEYAPWGLYIALFLFFEALCAGTLFIAALGGNNLPRLKMAVIGTVSGICAGIAILPDLGSPLTAWRLLFAPNVTAPMILDVWFLGLTVVFGILLIIGLGGNKEGLTRLSRMVLSLVTILLPLGTAWLFTTLPGKIGWSSSLEIAVFIVQAALAGLCVLFVLQKLSRIEENKTPRLVLALLLVDLALIIGEMGQAFYSSSIEVLPVKALLNSDVSAVFWCQIIVGVIFPAILLAIKKAPVFTGIISLCGIVLSKYLFVVKGNLLPYLNAGEGLSIPALGNAFNGFQMAPGYTPSGFEWLVGIGVFALGVLLINVILPLVTDKQAGTTNIPQDITQSGVH